MRARKPKKGIQRTSDCVWSGLAIILLMIPIVVGAFMQRYVGNFYCNRGRVYANKGDFDKAAADYTEAIRLNPEYPELLYFSTVVRPTRAGAMGQCDCRATPRLSESTRNTPNINRTIAYEKNGNKAKGEEPHKAKKSSGWKSE